MFHEASYESHARAYAADRTDPERKRIADSWYDMSTADAWRHERGFEIADYLGGVPGDRWLTLGDGRFGLDATRLIAQGVLNVTATDIDDSLLREAAEQGRARKGAILVEPNDRRNSPLRIAREVVRRMLGKARRHMDAKQYEPSGNYIFSISPREIEKVALGINLPQIAFKGLNDCYIAGVEFAPADKASPLFRKMRRRISFEDFLCRIGLERWGYLMACLFHEPVSAGNRSKMEQNGWTFIDLPRNPYINGS